jgi:hypothetical protein
MTFSQVHDLAIDQATTLLAAQLASAGFESGYVPAGSRMIHEFSLGSVWGVCEAHQVHGIPLSKESFAAIAIVYLNVYGALIGADSCGRALRFQEDPIGAFGDGMALGKAEAAAFLEDGDDEAPMGLARYLRSPARPE